VCALCSRAHADDRHYLSGLDGAPANPAEVTVAGEHQSGDLPGGGRYARGVVEFDLGGPIELHRRASGRRS
jgi:hypothetical protein